jgi:hypothetical protein
VTDVLGTAADAAYGYHALNLAGSVKANSDLFDRIEVFDLGLTQHQRALLNAVPGVEVREVPPFSPHWAQCFTWKPWAWQQIQADRVFWLDAGASVLRSLGAALGQIGDIGYFLASQGNELGDILPPDYFERYGVPAERAAVPYVAAGIIGFAPGAQFFRQILEPTYEDCLAGLNLGYSPGEVDVKNVGLGRMDDPPLRDCAHFRWDQSVLNARLARDLPEATVGDLDRYAGWRSPRDHPQQVIWSHRRGAPLRYLKRVPYSERQTERRAWGAYWQLRWSLRRRRKQLRERYTFIRRIARS